MNRRPPLLGPWLLAGALLLLPLIGLVPMHRDLPGYFVPIRRWTASELASGRIPWLNPLNGCGESWFANPQTGVLYPPAWIWLFLPAGWALTLEIAVHLAWFSLGAGLLGWRWSGERRAALSAQAVALAAPPVLAMAGMLNNLETLAWLPWMVLAACSGRRSRVLLLPLAVAGGWLGAAPVLWVFGLVAVLAVSPRDRWTLAGVGLGILLIAVQLLPFVAWVLEGDRGMAGGSAQAILAGALDPLRGPASLLVPGVVASGWVETLFLGGPLVAAALVALRRRPIVGVAVGTLLAVSVMPGLGLGQAYLALTAGLVRYPSRFAVPAVLLLAAMGVLGLAGWLRGEERWGSGIVGVLTGAACLVTSPWGAVSGAVLAVLLLAAALWPARRGVRAAALAVSFVASLVMAWSLLAPGPTASATGLVSPWWEARARGRLFSPQPDSKERRRLAKDPELRGLWAVGYTNLPAGIATAGSPAPVTHREVARLMEAAADPGGLWMLRAAGVRWLALPARWRTNGLAPVRGKKGVWLHRDRRGWPRVLLAAKAPSPGHPPRVLPGVLTVLLRENGLDVQVTSGGGGTVLIAMAPIAGWRWRVDGAIVRPRTGPPVLQLVQVGPGTHRIEGRFRAPFLGVGLAGSLLAVVALLILLFVPRVREVVR